MFYESIAAFERKDFYVGKVHKLGTGTRQSGALPGAVVRIPRSLHSATSKEVVRRSVTVAKDSQSLSGEPVK